MSNEGDANAPPAAAAAAAETPTDDDKIVVTSHVEQDAYPYGEPVDCWAMVSLKAPAYEPTERSAIDLVAVVDKSGSMSGEKMKLVKETMHFVVDQRKSKYWHGNSLRSTWGWRTRGDRANLADRERAPGVVDVEKCFDEAVQVVPS